MLKPYSNPIKPPRTHPPRRTHSEIGISARRSKFLKGTPTWFLAKWVLEHVVKNGTTSSSTARQRCLGCKKAKCFLGGLGYQGQTTTQCQGRSGLLALPPSAAGPTNHSLLEMVCCFLALVPQASKKPRGQKPLRDPFDKFAPK